MLGNLQCDSMRKSPTAWVNLYGAVKLGMGDTIFSRGGRKFTETACPKRGPWFRKFVWGSKLSMAVINRQYFDLTLYMVKELLSGWEVEW